MFCPDLSRNVRRKGEGGGDGESARASSLMVRLIKSRQRENDLQTQGGHWHIVGSRYLGACMILSYVISNLHRNPRHPIPPLLCAS